MTADARDRRDVLLREFADELDGVRLAAGKPTYAELERRHALLRRATVSDALTGKTSPSFELTVAFVEACRAVAEDARLPVDDPLFDVDAWHARWFELQVALRPHRRGRPRRGDVASRSDTAAGGAVVPGPPSWARPWAHGPVEPVGSESSVNRADELVTAITEAYGVGLTTVWISGAGGSGKTALAVRWASAARERFTDDVLFVGLGAHTDGGPVPIETALASLVERLTGRGQYDGPWCREFLTLRYRELAAERRLLVIADDAAPGHEVERLVPAGAGSFTIVTSRHEPAGTSPDEIVLPIEKWAS